MTGGFQSVGADALRAAYSRRLWLLLGIANVTAGVLIALRVQQSPDVTTVTQWCRTWIQGVNPYPGSMLRTNYPPYALALLSPLALVPPQLLKGLWAITSVGLAVAAGYLGLRITGANRLTAQTLRLPVGFFLAWESVRIGLGLGQFTLLAMVCGFGAVIYRGTIGRGMLLGLALLKPQIGAAFVLWALLEGSIVSVVWAIVPIVCGTLLFAARLGQHPLTVVGLYGSVLREELAVPAFRQGALELRPLIHDLIPQAAVADVLHLMIVIGSLAMLVVVSRRMSRPNRALFLLPLTCLWTLMSVYHPTYDLVMLWPAMTALSTWYSDTRAKPLAVGALLAIQLVLVVDVPGLWWKLNGRPFPVGDHGLLTTAILHFDRLLVSALFTTLVALSLRWQANRKPVALANAIPVS